MSEPARLPGDPAIRVLLIDNSTIIRGLVRKMLETEPDIAIVGSVPNGAEALNALGRMKCDVVLLDIEMPVMDGMTALPQILAKQPGIRVIMASTLTQRNAEITFEALRIGASDYVTKPTSTRGADVIEDYKIAILSRIRALGMRPPKAEIARALPTRPRHTPSKPRVIAIGSSTGGPQALLALFTKLGPSVRQPIFVTQHMPATFTAILASHIARSCGRDAREGVDGEAVAEGRVYVAPAGKHMLVERVETGVNIVLSDAPPENFCKPAVDPMFRSLAHAYGEGVAAIVLTGMGSDGAHGCEEIARLGGRFVVQDAATSVVWGMPGAAAKTGAAEAILPLGEIAPWLNAIAQGR